MGFERCVKNAVEAGELEASRAEEALKLYARTKDIEIKKMGENAADAKAARKVFEAMKFQAKEKKRTAALMVRIAEKRQIEINGFRNNTGELDRPAGFRALYERHSQANYGNVVAIHDEITARSSSIMNEVLTEYRLTVTGNARNQAGFRDVVHELFGTDTKSPQAKNFAKAVSEAQEYVRLRYNAAGGRIPKKRGFGMSQGHSKEALVDAGKKEWVEFVLPKLDRDKMLDYDTGLAMTEQELEKAVNEIWENIVKEDLSREAPDMFLGAKSNANKRLDHRFLTFKNSTSWLEYSERFGNGDPFSQLMSHLDGMGRDIAMMETFGPNPTAMKAFLRERVEKWAKDLTSKKIKKKRAFKVGTSSWTSHSNKTLLEAERMDDLFTGTANSPINEAHANGFAMFQSLHVSAVLGSAMLSAISDVGTAILTAGAAKLPMFKMLRNTAKNFAGMNRVDRIRLSGRLSLIMDNQAGIANTQMRYVGEVMGPELMQRLSHTTLNISLLSPWTKSWRWGFGQTFLGELHDIKALPFEKLQKGMQETMERYGITANDWKYIRETESYDAAIDFSNLKSSESTKFFDIRKLSERGSVGGKDLSLDYARDLAGKVSRMIGGETEFAIPSTSLRGQAILKRGSRPGSVEGSTIRSFAMYKSYMATLMLTHMERIYSKKGAANKAKAFGALFLMNTVSGSLALQLKDISKGKDPRQMFNDNGTPNLKFLGAAIAQGGGLGIFGDFIFSDITRYGRNFSDTFTGPGLSFLDDVANIGIANVQRAAAGDETRFGRDFVDFARRYTPGQSLWYSRLALERLVFDQVQEGLDPDAKDRFRRRESKMLGDFGQRYWWKQGEVAPQRGPDFSTLKQ